jgi:hypothetical protein
MVGVAMDLAWCHGLIIGQLYHAIPQVFPEITGLDKAPFCCSDSWVRKLLYHQLDWRHRQAIHAAQKLPANVGEVCHGQFLQLSLTIYDGIIQHAQFLVNINQSNVQYQPGSALTYKKVGSKQVAVVGQEEKCAFTLVVGISTSGDLLPFQAIYGGKSPCSLPSKKLPPLHNEATSLGIHLELSNTDTYWSRFNLMCKYVNTILVLYWLHQKEIIGADPDDECILQWDVWSVLFCF